MILMKNAVIVILIFSYLLSLQSHIAALLGLDRNDYTEEYADRKLMEMEEYEPTRNVSITRVNHISTSYVDISRDPKRGTYIMFWRVQKVGSSTLLSLFMSYAFRYKRLPRQRGQMNSFCKKLYGCITANPSYSKLRNSRPDESIIQYADRTYDTGNSSERLNERHIHDETFDSALILTDLQRKKIETKIGAYYYSKFHPYQRMPHASGFSSRDLRERQIEQMRYYMSLDHQLCDVNSRLVHDNLQCAFEANDASYFQWEHRIRDPNVVKEVFAVREPLARMISAYYFWGEIAKLRSSLKSGHTARGNHRLGDGSSVGTVRTKNFTYHGDESTVPNYSIAMEFATKFPLNHGMPGPSYTWTAFADSPYDAVDVVRSDRLMTVVTERLDESLVVLSHFLNWSIADMVIVAPRKALSTHPKANSWPRDAIVQLRNNLESSGEMSVYREANEMLNQRIQDLKSSQINFENEVLLLKNLRERVTTVRGALIRLRRSWTNAKCLSPFRFVCRRYS